MDDCRSCCPKAAVNGSRPRLRTGETSLDTALDVALDENLELLPEAVPDPVRATSPSSPSPGPSPRLPTSSEAESSIESSLSISRCVCSSFCCSSAKLRTRRRPPALPDSPERSLRLEPDPLLLREKNPESLALSVGVMARSRVRKRGDAAGVVLRVPGAEWKTSALREAEEAEGVGPREEVADDGG